MSASSFSALSASARRAGACLGRLSVSASGSARVSFVFSSPAVAAVFASSVSGPCSWASLVAGVACRGRVVVVRLWAAPSPRPSWCGSVAVASVAPVPPCAPVRAGRWSSVGFFLRGLGFVQSSSESSLWHLPPGSSCSVRLLAAARAGVRLFGCSAVPSRPYFALFPYLSGRQGWGLCLLARA